MLNLEDIRSYCLNKPYTSEDLPFGEDTLVFRVMGKIFLLTGLNSPDLSVNLKCDPEFALELREKYEDIIPGFHMNKKMWNTVIANGLVPDRLLLEMVDHSYDQVVNGLPAKTRALLLNVLPE